MTRERRTPLTTQFLKRANDYSFFALLSINRSSSGKNTFANDLLPEGRHTLDILNENDL
jgi:hypothetical protein